MILILIKFIKRQKFYFGAFCVIFSTPNPMTLSIVADTSDKHIVEIRGGFGNDTPVCKSMNCVFLDIFLSLIQYRKCAYFHHHCPVQCSLKHCTLSLQISNTQHEPEKDSIEPETRNAGCGVIVGEKLFVWGGQTERVGGMRYLPCSESHPFDVFDFTTKMWSHQPTSGDVPELGIGSSLIAYCGWFYLYGGLTEYEENVFAGDIYKVSMDTFQWKIIAIPPACKTTIKPSPRYTAGIILHDDRLCMFGGVGPKIVEDQDPGAEWVKAVNRDKGAFGWNNEYYEFDLKAGKPQQICYGAIDVAHIVCLTQLE